MSLVATCPSCGTVFSMVREQLEASGGQVRCGHCMSVFDASASNTDMTQEAVLASECQPTLSFVQQAQKQAFWAKKYVRIGLAVTAFLLILLLALQLLRSAQERSWQIAPSLQPVAQKLCTLWTCSTPVRLQIDGWRIENSNFQKEGENAFRLTIQLKNISPVSLLIPQLELSLIDVNDAILLRRAIKITAEQSLSREEERIYYFLITPKPNVQNSIVGYRLVLFYP